MQPHVTRLALTLALLGATVAPAQMLQAGAQEGLAAPRFNATPVNGKPLRLDRLMLPNGTLLAVLNQRVVEAQRLLAFLEQSRTKLAESEIRPVVFLIGGGQQRAIEDMVKQNNLQIPVIPDDNQKYSKLFGVDGVAAVILVDNTGTVFRRYDYSAQGADLGPLALGGVKDMLEAQQKAAGGATPPATPATTTGEGTAPAAPPTDEQVRQRVAQGWDLIQRGLTAAALEDARQLDRQRGGKDWMSALWLAYALEADRRYPESAVTYRRLLELRPGNLYALQAIQRIDPLGRYRSAEDLPQDKPAPAANRGEGEAVATP